MTFTKEQLDTLQQVLPQYFSWDVDNEGQVIIYTDIWVEQ